ncbi:nuclear pore glycoprotein p62 isoform X7 [Phascolarctos cinereus]
MAFCQRPKHPATPHAKPRGPTADKARHEEGRSEGLPVRGICPLERYKKQPIGRPDQSEAFPPSAPPVSCLCYRLRCFPLTGRRTLAHCCAGASGLQLHFRAGSGSGSHCAATSAPTTTSGPTLFASIANSSLPVSSAPTLSVGAPSTSVAAPGLGVLGFGLKLPSSTSAATSTTTTTTSTTTTGFALNLKPLSTPGTGIIPSTCATLPSATTVPSITPVMTYAQLESLINKWSLELEDQEKHFLQQATQVNAWDRTLIENGEKITSLHREVEKVKLDQKRLDQELDFILSQQKELEDLLAPLEEAVKEQSGTIYLQHADEEREKTYKLAENIDAQLKRMAQDLKDIIEHLNMSGGPPDTSDPLQQICKILNAHMDSLQWIDQNSALLQRKVEEVSKVCESRRKEQERNYRIVFD